MTPLITLPALTAVAVGGALGSVVRYVTGVMLLRAGGGFPLGTFVVNVLGALLIGIFAGLAMESGTEQLLRLALISGFCGGFTTFSTLSAETITLVQEGRLTLAAMYVIATLVLGLGATMLGLMLVTPRPQA